MGQKQICPLNVTSMPHIPITSYIDIRQLYQYKCNIYRLNAINSITTALVYFHFIILAYALNKYVFDTACVHPNAWIRYSMCRPHITAHKSKKKTTKSNFIYHTLTIHVSATNMSFKCYSYAIYAKYFMHRYETTMSEYIPNTNSVQSIMWPEALVYIHYTLLAYALEQIYLPYCTYMSHCTCNVVYINTPHYCTYPLEVNKLQKFTILLKIVCQ